MRCGLFWALVGTACAAPPRTSFARCPGAPSERDASQSDARAIAIADRVLFAAGGRERWNQAHVIRWTQTVVADPAPALVDAADDAPRALPRGPFRVELPPSASEPQDRVWDRWSGRYTVRRRHLDAVETVIVIDLYSGAATVAARTRRGERLDTSIAEGDGGARATWHVDTALLCLPFLLGEPGARLADLGTAFSDEGELDQIRVTFPDDPTRASAAIELLVDHSAHIARVVVETPATQRRVTYELTNWVTVAGLAFPTTRTELASGQRTQITKLSTSALSE